MKTILHIDFDSYFASCEQQFDAKFRDKPIGVTAQNGRTCIIAASREAKKLGIKSPSRTFEALQKVPDIGPKVAQSIYDWFRELRNVKFLERLESAGVGISAGLREAQVAQGDAGDGTDEEGDPDRRLEVRHRGPGPIGAGDGGAERVRREQQRRFHQRGAHRHRRHCR